MSTTFRIGEQVGELGGDGRVRYRDAPTKERHRYPPMPRVLRKLARDPESMTRSEMKIVAKILKKAGVSDEDLKGAGAPDEDLR